MEQSPDSSKQLNDNGTGESHALDEKGSGAAIVSAPALISGGRDLEERRRHFMQMLKDKGVTAFSMWDEVKGDISDNQRLKAIPTPDECESLFYQYVRTLEEKDQRTRKQAACRANWKHFNQLQERAEEIGIVSFKDFVNPEIEDFHYNGRRESCFGSISRSFIPCELKFLDNYRQRTAVQMPHILSSVDVIEAPFKSSYSHLLVTEEVESIRAFFKKRFQEFVKKEGYTINAIKNLREGNQTIFMEDWWRYIEVDFKKICSEVADGVLEAYSCGVPVGGLWKHIFVSKGSGKILPFMTSSGSYSDDIKDLIKTMEEIVYQSEFNLRAKKNYIPFRLQSFFSTKTEGLTIRMATLALSHPFFWTSPSDGISFMRKLRKVNQANLVKLCFIEKVMLNMESDDFAGVKWNVFISDPRMLGVLNFGKNGDGCSTYTNAGDIVRYFIAVCNHANEKGLPHEVITENHYALMFEQLYPNLYAYLFQVVRCIADDTLTLPKVVDYHKDSLLEYFFKSVAP